MGGPTANKAERAGMSLLPERIQLYARPCGFHPKFCIRVTGHSRFAANKRAQPFVVQRYSQTTSALRNSLMRFSGWRREPSGATCSLVKCDIMQHDSSGLNGLTQKSGTGGCMDLKDFLILISILVFLTFAASVVGLAFVMTGVR
jgi:hypothetical protein